jgi:hypothetical protein
VIRTQREIDHAIGHLERMIAEAVVAEEHAHVMAALIECLKWVSGSSRRGGFGEMLADLDAADAADLAEQASAGAGA